MNQYKVYVYAICKNEEKFVSGWVQSMMEADGIYVLDTGSTDHTVAKLKELGVHVVEKEIVPWRFDVARNESLKLVPEDADICVCTDLDEVFEKGWRKSLEEVWKPDFTCLGYTYHWSIDQHEHPVVSYYLENIHSRGEYTWTHPVHEVLKYIGTRLENRQRTDKIVLKHYPDHTKSRSSYLPLLELSVQESPEDDRNMHYLGREYMYYGKWNEAIDTLIRHLKLPTATWKDERCASMRFIARSYKQLNRIEEARMWLNKAIQEAPYLRDPYIEKAILEYEQKNWPEVERLCLEALKIKSHAKTYINEVFSWDYTVYDILSIATFYLGKWDVALENVKIALSFDPDNERLKENLKIIENYASIA